MKGDGKDCENVQKPRIQIEKECLFKAGLST